MPPVLGIWLQFAVCVVLVGVAGPELSRSGDIIAEKTSLSGTWVGLMLIATVTSLPELVTGLSAVTVANAPDIAVGDVFGSCVFNLAILVVLDFIQRGETIYRRASQGHVLSAGFGIVLTGFAGMNLLLREEGRHLAIGHIGIYTPITLVLYVVAMRSLFAYEKTHREQFAEEVAERYPNITLRSAVVRYVIASLVAILAGIWLPFIGASLADAMDWRRTFVGTLLVAGVTSLPEVVVTVAAVRIGAVDMAIANLLGSNLFDMAVLSIDDIFFAKGPLLYHVSPIHAVSALSAVIMTGIAVVGLFYRPKARLFSSVAWTSLGIFVMYLLNSYILFLHGR